MSAVVREDLMALGEVTIDLEPDPEISSELVKGPNGEERDGRGLIIRWAEFPEPFGCVKVGHIPSRDVITVKAVGLEWYLGEDDIGPTDVDKVYVAGNNKLANPVFQYTFTEESTDDFGNPTTRVTADSWKLAEQTGWIIAVGSATVTNALRALLTDEDVDLSLPSDILTSDESFEVAAGDLLRQIVTASRANGSVGRYRNRLVFDGHFRHPNILPALASWTVDPDNLGPSDAHIFTTGTKRVEIGPVTREIRTLDTGWSDTSETPGDTLDSGTELHIGPCTQPQYIPDPSFENGFTDWIGNTSLDPDSQPRWSSIASLATGYGTITPRTGSLMMEAYASGAVGDTPDRYLGPPSGPSVKPGERYRLSGYVIERSFTRGTAMLLLTVSRLTGFPHDVQSVPFVGSFFKGSPPNNALQWRELHVEYTVGSDDLGILPFIYVSFTIQDDGRPTGTGFFFDDVTLTRIKGNTCQSADTPFSVISGDTYEITSQAFASTNMTDGEVVMAVTMTGSGKDPITVKSNPITPDNKTTTVMKATITPDDGYTDAYVTFNGTDVAGDEVVCNYPVVTRTVGNTAKVDAPALTVIPEESYTFRGRVTAGAGVTQGTIGVSFLCQGSGRPDQVIDAFDIDAESLTPQGIVFPFATPSGYDTVIPSLVGTDILGGKFTVYPPTFSLTDNKRKAVDAVSGKALGQQNTALNVTVPIGAEHVHTELVAEDKADGFAVASVFLARAETPWKSGAVAKDLLKDPETGRQLVQEGNIVGAEPINWTWHVRNLHQRTKLQHLSRSGLATPVREWRFYLDATSGRPTMDWGTPEVIFEDRTDLVFVEDDLKVIAEPQTEHSGRARVTKVRLIGADRERPDGPPIQITGEATNPNTDFLDWDGEPLTRTRTVTDTSATHRDYAAALARYAADIVAAPDENIRVQIVDWRAWATKGPFHVGDWVYVFKPSAGIFDLGNPMQYEGRTIWPKKLRVISRTWRLGAGDFHLEVHRPGLDPFEVNVDLVRWEAETTAELELGDPLPEFQFDEEGGPALDQLRRLRASMPTR